MIWNILIQTYMHHLKKQFVTKSLSLSLSLSLFCFGYICDSFRGEGEGYFVTNCFFRWCMYVCMRIFQTMTTTLWITFYNHSSISNDNCKTITFKRVNSWLINMGPNLVRMSYKTYVLQHPIRSYHIIFLLKTQYILPHIIRYHFYLEKVERHHKIPQYPCFGLW